MANKLKKASEEQKNFIINYMENNVAFFQDKFEGVDGSHTRMEKWKHLSEQLNCLGGAVKDPQKWKKFWTDQKSHIKEKEALLKASFQRSGINGPQKMKPQTDFEKRVLQLMVPEVIVGNDGVDELFVCQNNVEERIIEEFLEDDLDAVITENATSSNNTAAVVTPTPLISRKRKTASSGRTPQGSDIEDRLLKIEEEELAYIKKKYYLMKEQVAADEKWRDKYLEIENKKLKIEERKIVLEEKKFEQLLNQ